MSENSLLRNEKFFLPFVKGISIPSFGGSVLKFLPFDINRAENFKYNPEERESNKLERVKRYVAEEGAIKGNCLCLCCVCVCFIGKDLFASST